MDCPKCDSVMEEVTYHGITVDRCTECKGIWFPGIEHKELKRLKGSESIDIGSAKVGKQFDELENVLCPVCEDKMETVADKFQPHIHYEVCAKSHGVYFDAGEFKDFKEETLSDFIKSLSMAVRRKH
jgi:uncharacterized protein